MHTEAMYRRAFIVALLCIGLGAPLQVQAWAVYNPGVQAYHYNYRGYAPRYYYAPGTYYSYPQPYFGAVPVRPYYYNYSYGYYNRPFFSGHRHHFRGHRHDSRSRHFGFRHRSRSR